MAAGGFGHGATRIPGGGFESETSPTPRARITWARGRNSSLLGFAEDGRLIYHFSFGDFATPQEISYVRLALAIINVRPLHEYMRKGKHRGQRQRH